jgi:spore maturation protein CgeB
MKFVIFGLTISSSWGNGHATLWRGLGRALARRGHRVVFFERDVSYYPAQRDLTDWPDGELCLFTDWAEALPRARQHLAEADVAIVTSYCPDGVAATQLVIESEAPAKVFYDLDTPVTLDAVASGRAVTYIGPRGLADFDLVLSFTGGRALDELRTKLGARRVAPLYGSVDPEVHHHVAPQSRFRADLSYLGTYAEDRQATLEALFLEPARRLPERRFLIGGAQYPTVFPWLDNVFFAQHLEPAQHPAFFSSSRLTLNVTRRAMKAMGYCPSGRLFEAAACGTPLLTDYWEGLDLFFEPGSEIIVARDSDEATAAIELPYGALQGIAKRARERVLDQHTAAHRARELETALEEVGVENRTIDLESSAPVLRTGDLVEGDRPLRDPRPTTVEA